MYLLLFCINQGLTQIAIQVIYVNSNLDLYIYQQYKHYNQLFIARFIAWRMLFHCKELYDAKY